VRWRTRHPCDLLQRTGGLHEPLVAARVEARDRLATIGRPFGAGILGGLLLGDRRLVPEPAAAALQASGLGHLLAVSGLHVGGLAFAAFALVAWCARRLHAVHPRRWGAAVAIPAALAFVALAQAPMSARRAGLMVCLWFVGLLVARRGDPLNLLGFAALVVLAGDPKIAGSVGFQLSFGAVASLVLLVSAAPELRHSWLRGLLATSVVASAATAPIIAWHFGLLAPASVVANLLVTPVAAACLVPLGVLGLLLEPLTSAPLTVAAHGAELSVAVAETLLDATGGQRVVGWYSAPAVAIPFVVLACARLRGSAGRRVAAAVGAGALLALGAWALRPTGARAEFVAVGQGDAVLLRDGQRAALVDAGPDPNAWALLAYLRREGVDRLDYAIVSHGHPDHFGGMAVVARAMPIGRLFGNGRWLRGRSWRRLEAALWRQGARVERAAGQWSLGSMMLTLEVPYPRSDASENDASAIVHVSGPGASLLLTGDLERAGEAALAAGGVPRVTVLKAAHHGSRTSSTVGLIEAVCPTAVVFTVGPDNRYGFPHPQVRARYRERGIAMWRTDLDGRVLVELGVEPAISALYRDPVRLDRAGGARAQGCARAPPPPGRPRAAPRS